jgi:hydroxyacylglutathione hydrolase
MPGQLVTKSVGPWPMNTYLVACPETYQSVVIDPGADLEEILALARNSTVSAVLITHGHPDHVGALAEIKAATGAPVYLHPAEASEFGVSFDRSLEDGQIIQVGTLQLRAIHTPGHTPGMTCFDLGDHRVIVGDTIFQGGPGKTWSAKDFSRTMDTMREIVFRWPDETEFYPGHGGRGRIGEERPAFEAFLKRGWPPNLFGDVTWSG